MKVERRTEEGRGKKKGFIKLSESVAGRQTSQSKTDWKTPT